ncbi:MAG: exodeoxyribonuclease IX [Gammaproteobacteria bacterium]|nr:exodeoxyribonuclease IX [Gammaproteobacteria bacterium]
MYVFRAYYSLPPEMVDRDGNPVHALYGFARFMGDLIEREKPRYVAVAFDASLSTSFRNQIYPAYKANREPAPPDLVLQFERCRQYCERLGIAWFDSPEFEADDLIGTLAARMRAEGLRSTIVSRDKDLAQLITPGDVYWDYSGNARYHHGEIEGRFGVAPDRYADYLALTGDAVDNIAGVPGVGPKTATVLMRAFATLEELYERLDVVHDLPLRGAAAVVARLAQHREAAFLARQLTRIRCDVMLPVTRHQLQRRPPDLPAIDDFCGSNGFGSLIRNQAARLPQA